MKFTASFYNPPIFGKFMTALFAILAFLFMFVQEFKPVLIIVSILIFTILRFKNRTMEFSQDAFHYRDWFNNFSVSYADILKVECGYKFGYPIDRIHSNDYRITTQNKKYWVSTIWFNHEANKQFSEKILKKNKK